MYFPAFDGEISRKYAVIEIYCLMWECAFNSGCCMVNSNINHGG